MQQETKTENGITYVKRRDYWIPELEIPEQKAAGRFGRMRLKFIRENRKALYDGLICRCELNSYLSRIDEEAEEMARQALRLVGLDPDEVGQKAPFELSGGQKRRAAIAGVIVMKPKILVLDEPTAGLDPYGKEQILDLVLRLKEECSPTVIVISHDMDEITRYASRLVVFGEGKVAFDLPMEQLFEHGRELEELGLEIPTAVRLATALKARGIDLGGGIVNMDTFTAAVLKKFAEKGVPVKEFCGIDWFGERSKKSGTGAADDNGSADIFGEGI